MKDEHKNNSNLSGVKQVPTLFDNEKDLSLSQSMAVMQYLDDFGHETNTPLLFPACPVLKAKTIEIAEIHNSFMQPLQNLSVLRKLEAMNNSPDRALSRASHTSNTKAWCQEFCHQGLQATEQLINADTKFSISDNLTACDLFIYPMVVNCLTRHGINLENYPKIRQVMENMKVLDVVQKAHPKNQEDTPEDYDFSKWEY